MPWYSPRHLCGQAAVCTYRHHAATVACFRMFHLGVLIAVRRIGACVCSGACVSPWMCMCRLILSVPCVIVAAKGRCALWLQCKNSALPCETRTNARQMGTRHMSAQTLLQVAHLAVWRVALSWVRLFVFRHATQPVIHLHTTRRQQPTIDTHRPPKQPSYSMAAG